MVIQTSNVALAATSYRETAKYESVSYSGGWGNSIDTAGFLSAAPQATDGARTDVTTITDTLDLYELESVTGRTATPEQPENDSFFEGLTSAGKLEFASLENLFRTISERSRVKKISPEELFEQLLSRMRRRAELMLSGLLPGTGKGPGYGEQYVNMEVTKYTEVMETTAFQGSGTAVTADGRTIEFGVSMTSSSSFTEATKVEIDFKQLYLTDPLVVNLSDNLADISDRRFYFDIDMDGEEDNIAMLGKMSGFLALDRNEDGVINDGSELFGAKTGNGFKELAVFDLDGNGWIDENDEVFNRLRIWTKDEDGNDRLAALGVAGIGAIYLGNVTTDSNIYAPNGDISAVARSAGLYLREDGTAGSIQHVDIAKIL